MFFSQLMGKGGGGGGGGYEIPVLSANSGELVLWLQFGGHFDKSVQKIYKCTYFDAYFWSQL